MFGASDFFAGGSATGPFRVITLPVIVSALFVSSAANAQIEFEDATGSSGIVYQGETFGASWGDLNADGLPDLYKSNHRSMPSLLVNQGNGSFVDEADTVRRWVIQPNLDMHGGSWGDFNKDGFEDLFVSTGATDDEQFFFNDKGQLEDRTEDYGLVESLEGRPGRLPVWYDYNRDGRLDWSLMGRGFPQVWRQKLDGFFSNEKPTTGFSCRNVQFGQLVDLNDDGVLELICDNQTEWPNRIYDMTTLPFTDITSSFPMQEAVNDTAIGDFDGNLRNDVFALRGGFRISEAALSDVNSIEAQLNVGSDKSETFTFETEGPIEFTLDWNRRNRANIFIGADGYNPGGFTGQEKINFTLDPEDSNNQGLKEFDPAVDEGVYIGYFPGSDTWRVTVAAGGSLQTVYFFIDSENPIENLQEIGFSGSDGPVTNKLVMSFPGGLFEQSENRGVRGPVKCVSAAAADYDNDMDMDLYLVCRDGVSNLPNIFYENQGDGTFVAIEAETGAEGPVGVGGGQGESVAIADYDVDGFMDIFVTNGLNLYPEQPLFESRGGPDKLFRNKGNANRWIQIDLVGIDSNRSSIGAKVYATAGGKTQLREQNGGYHRWSQNHQRIHFGLASNATVDLRIEWPNGEVDTYDDVQANRLYRATEGSSLEPLSVGGPVTPPECGRPDIDPSTQKDIFVWKNCNDGEWHVRTTAGGTSSDVSGRIVANANITEVTAVNIEDDDTLSTPNDREVFFRLQSVNTAADEFTFRVPANAQACLEITRPASTDTLRLGSRQVSASNGFDVNTLEPCSNSAAEGELSIRGTTVREDEVWANFTVTMSEPVSGTVTVDYVTNKLDAESPADYRGAKGTLTFPPNTTSQTIAIRINNDSLGEKDERFRVRLRNPSGATIAKAVASAKIIDDEISACGAPNINPAKSQGIFVWTDCETDTWFVRVAGAGAARTFAGMVTTPRRYQFVNPYNLEANDKLIDRNVGEIRYILRLNGPGLDGFAFRPKFANDELCFQPNNPNMMLKVGNDKLKFRTPLNLQTLQSCGGP